MFDFHITCNDNASPACSAMDTYNRAGQIISDNLILNTKIIVEITVERRPETFWGATYPAKVFNNLDDIRRYFPTALIKQVQPGFPPTGTDIFITINSSRDPDTYYPGTGQIQANQHDFLELVLHELQHGLGFETVWYQLQGNDLFPDFDYTLDNNGVVTFQSFKENIFDYFLVVHPIGRGVERTTPYVQALNTMAGPFGKTYNNMGSSISHFAKDVYSTTSDFLLISESQAGKTLEDKVAAYGNDPGEGMGPDLRSLLATMGYELRIPGSPPVKSSNKITTNNSTDSKLKSVVNNRNKKKRIVAL
ncbi:2235_t:CDS:2 [Rhizophagus irregularis]|nr:2235_t:CDS:2 [Rhizophagus irregularis]